MIVQRWVVLLIGSALLAQLGVAQAPSAKPSSYKDRAASAAQAAAAGRLCRLGLG